MKKLITAFLIITFGFVSQGIAGWVFVEDSDGENRITYIQKNRVKLDAPDQAIYMDLNQNRLTILDPERKVYWSGEPQLFESRIRESQADVEKALTEDFMEAAGGEDEVVKEALADIKQKTSENAIDVNIQKTDKTEKLAGYDAVKYEIRIDGKLKQEQWISEDMDITGDLDVEKFGEMMRGFQSGLGASPETLALSSEAGVSLLKKGWPLKTVDYRTDIDTRTDKTVKVRKGDIESEVFEIPSDYKEISLEELFGK